MLCVKHRVGSSILWKARFNSSSSSSVEEIRCTKAPNLCAPLKHQDGSPNQRKTGNFRWNYMLYCYLSTMNLKEPSLRIRNDRFRPCQTTISSVHFFDYRHCFLADWGVPDANEFSGLPSIVLYRFKQSSKQSKSPSLTFSPQKSCFDRSWDFKASAYGLFHLHQSAPANRFPGKEQHLLFQKVHSNFYKHVRGHCPRQILQRPKRTGKPSLKNGVPVLISTWDL